MASSDQDNRYNASRLAWEKGIDIPKEAWVDQDGKLIAAVQYKSIGIHDRPSDPTPLLVRVRKAFGELTGRSDKKEYRRLVLSLPVDDDRLSMIII